MSLKPAVRVSLKDAEGIIILMKRRDFLSRTLATVPWILGSSLIWPAGRFLLFAESRQGTLNIPLVQIPEGITPFPSARIFIRRKGDNITLFDAHCTHMGCLLHYDTDHQVFNCPCHHSRFDQEGHRLRGPAKRDLDTLSFVLTATSIIVK